MSTSRQRVLLLENVHPVAARLFEAAGYEVKSEANALSRDELIAALDGVDVLGIRSSTDIDRKVLEESPQLKTIGAFCIGTNQIDLAAASEHGVAVFNAPYANTRSVVELTLGEMLMLARRVPERSRQMHAGKWQKSAAGSNELRGKTLGIIGYGNIGSQLSVLAEALGMRVVFYDTDDKLSLGNAEACSMDELLAQSDVVTLHVDGRPANTNLIDAKAIEKTKNGVILINNSRGHVMDAEAVAAAVKSGHIAGVAADVHSDEPNNGGVYDSPLRGLENVILTPHIGGATIEAQEHIGRFASNKLLRYMQSGDSRLSVNLPGLALPQRENANRLLYIHRNVPGALAHINDLFESRSINIAGQFLATRDAIGYVIIDTESEYDQQLLEAMANLEEAIRVRAV